MRIASVVALVLLFGCAAPEPADLVFVGGTLHTLDPDNPSATALAAKDGFIQYVGRDAGARLYIGEHTRVVDLGGATVVPGFNDAHMHLAGVGERELQSRPDSVLGLNLQGTESLSDLLQKVAERVARTPAGEWVVGRGWIESSWQPPRFPTRFDLDTISPNHPVWLRRVDGHGAVANSMALKIAGVDRASKSPAGGEIIFDPDSGEPTGMLLDNAQGLVDRHVPARGNLEAFFIAGAEAYARAGWTGMQIAGMSWNAMELLRDLVEDGRVPLRVYDAIMFTGNAENAYRLIERGSEIAERGGRFNCRAIKVSFDGALGSGGAALLHDYHDRPGDGFLKHEDEELLPMLEAALREGIQIEFHAIGDRANRHTLDLYEKTFAKVPVEERAVADPRWRIEHAQILHRDDIPRFQELGVLPSMQPSHAITDLHFAPARLGLERLTGAYAWRSLIDSGCIIPGGSDAPVEAGDPLVEFYAAVARKDLKGFSDRGWNPQEAVTREEALKMLTIWPAYAAFEEEWRGTLAKGMACDLTILSRDIMAIPEEQIPQTKILMTVVAGKIAYER